MTTPTRHRDNERGSITPFVLIILTALFLMAGLILDGGLALATHTHAAGQAESAARAGAQAIDLTAYRTTGTLRLLPAQAATSTRRYLERVGATGTVNATDTTVTVRITATQPTQLLGLVGITTLTVHTTASAHPQTDALFER